MWKNKRKWLIISAFLILSLGGHAAYSYFLSPQQTETEDELQTAAIRQGNIEIIASGVGEIVPADEIDLSFSTSGIVAEINIRVGQRVQAGDVLARLGDLSQLQANIASAELSLLEAQQDLEDLYANAASVTAAAQLELADAEQALQDAAYDNYQLQPGNRASAEDYASTYASYILAAEALERAENAFNRVSGKSADNPEYANALSNMEQARANMESYYRLLQWYEAAPSNIEQSQLDAYIAIAEARVQQARRQWELVKDGPNPTQLAIAEARVATSQANLLTAQANFEGTVLIAPVDGTVLEINASVGETSASPMITMANIDQPLLRIYLDESDFDKIDLDYPVEIIFDSLPDDVFTGTVIQVDPVLTITDGVSTITGLVQLDPSDDVQLSRLPIGSNASIDVFAARVENATIVPIEALREMAPGEYAVFVMVDGQPQLRNVEVGLIDITYAEVISGLAPGETVTTGIVETE